MLVRLATLALLATLAAGGRLVFPDTTSSNPALGSRIGSKGCPYPLPSGSTLESLTSGCYDLDLDGAVGALDDRYLTLANADDANCNSDHVRDARGRCWKVTLRAQPAPPRKPSNGPEGKPNWGKR